MDCSICTSMPFLLRPPRNTICASCYEAARNIITLMNKLENSSEIKPVPEKHTSNCSSNSCKAQPLGNVTKWMNSMKETEDELKKKIDFLGSFVSAFKEQFHTDILINPGDNGTPIPSHRALLASKSEVFKNILDSDTCKAAPEDTITLHELNSEEIESLLEFLYTGTLPSERMHKHVYSLFVAADKYAIPYLQDFCEAHLLSSLNSSNVLDVLSVSDMCSNQRLKETSLKFIVGNMDDVVFSGKYEDFAPKNPHLCVQITREFLVDSKNRRASST